MRDFLISGKKVRVYDSIDDMPISVFQKYNKYILLDAGVGSDVNSIDEHIVKAAQLVRQGESDKAIQELQNLRQCISLVVGELSPKHLAFASIVHSIDGVRNNDLSDDHLRDIVAQLKDAPASLIDRIVDFVKKKYMRSLKHITRRSS